jgi:hypothetical protein
MQESKEDQRKLRRDRIHQSSKVRLVEIIQRPVLVPLRVDAVDFEDPSGFAEGLDGEAEGEDDGVEDDGDREEEAGEDERVGVLGSDEAEEDREGERDRLRGPSVREAREPDWSGRTQSGRISFSNRCRSSLAVNPSLSSSRADTDSLYSRISPIPCDAKCRTHPVTIKKAPTPPIHPTRICRGKNSLSDPSFM